MPHDHRPQRRVHLSLFVTGEERQLEPHASAFVAGIAVLALVGRVRPPVCRQQSGYSVVILEPHAEIQVVVRSRHCSGVEVNGPAAEEPVLDPLLAEQLVNPSERNELLALAHASLSQIFAEVSDQVVGRCSWLRSVITVV
jgi:hypothetical protein